MKLPREILSIIKSFHSVCENKVSRSISRLETMFLRRNWDRRKVFEDWQVSTEFLRQPNSRRFQSSSIPRAHRERGRDKPPVSLTCELLNRLRRWPTSRRSLNMYQCPWSREELEQRSARKFEGIFERPDFKPDKFPLYYPIVLLSLRVTRLFE